MPYVLCSKLIYNQYPMWYEGTTLCNTNTIEIPIGSCLLSQFYLILAIILILLLLQLWCSSIEFNNTSYHVLWLTKF